MIPAGSYISWLDVQVREQFEGKRWALPARVFARPLELYSGMRLEPKVLEEELISLGYQKTDQFHAPGQYQHNNNTFYIMTRAFQFWDNNEPSRMLEVNFKGNQVSLVGEARPSRKLALVRLEPRLIGKIYPTHHEDRVLIRLAEVPPLLVDALLTMEDRNFYSHFGVSIRGLIRASVENFKAGTWVQGGSTITQQLVKNLYLSPERTLDRKINEAMMALLLEWHYTKEQILEAYLNEVYLGQDGDRAIHGMGMAARFYFNRPVSELKLSEVALLVSLIRAASHYNPRKYPERALNRRNLVLDVMVEQEHITSAEAEAAKATPLGITNEPAETTFPYPAFMGLVQHQLREDYREEDLRSEGLKIFTTLDPFIQKLADEAMVSSLKKLGRRNLEGAMVVTNSANGEVFALANGSNPRYAGFNRPLNAERQIGSLVKVAIYLTALEKIGTYSLTSLLDDSPFRWVDKHTGEVWKPQNYDFRSHGRIPLFRALANSYNLATVRLGSKLGLDKVRETMRRMGIEREFKVYPSMLLGSVTLTPIEVAQMYQTIASGGFRIPLRAIREVLTHDGDPLQRYALSVEQRFDPSAVFLLNYAMQQVVRRGTGRKLGSTFPRDMVIAGKTGTSNDLRDSWFAGFTSELLAVTWVGRDDNKPMGLSGGTGAMYVWAQFMRTVRPESVAPLTPRQVQWRWVDFNSGRSSSGQNAGAIRIPFLSGDNVNARAYFNMEK
jgi:penicillin-binding protein 1B